MFEVIYAGTATLQWDPTVHTEYVSAMGYTSDPPLNEGTSDIVEARYSLWDCCTKYEAGNLTGTALPRARTTRVNKMFGIVQRGTIGLCQIFDGIWGKRQPGIQLCPRVRVWFEGEFDHWEYIRFWFDAVFVSKKFSLCSGDFDTFVLETCARREAHGSYIRMNATDQAPPRPPSLSGRREECPRRIERLKRRRGVLYEVGPYNQPISTLMGEGGMSKVVFEGDDGGLEKHRRGRKEENTQGGRDEAEKARRVGPSNVRSEEGKAGDWSVPLALSSVVCSHARVRRSFAAGSSSLSFCPLAPSVFTLLASAERESKRCPRPGRVEEQRTKNEGSTHRGKVHEEKSGEGKDLRVGVGSTKTQRKKGGEPSRVRSSGVGSHLVQMTSNTLFILHRHIIAVGCAVIRQFEVQLRVHKWFNTSIELTDAEVPVVTQQSSHQSRLLLANVGCRSQLDQPSAIKYGSENFTASSTLSCIQMLHQVKSFFSFWPPAPDNPPSNNSQSGSHPLGPPPPLPPRPGRPPPPISDPPGHGNNIDMVNDRKNVPVSVLKRVKRVPSDDLEIPEMEREEQGKSKQRAKPKPAFQGPRRSTCLAKPMSLFIDWEVLTHCNEVPVCNCKDIESVLLLKLTSGDDNGDDAINLVPSVPGDGPETPERGWRAVSVAEHKHKLIHAQVKQVNPPKFKLRPVRKSIWQVNRTSSSPPLDVDGGDETGIWGEREDAHLHPPVDCVESRDGRDLPLRAVGVT
ncbi:hypothetical protein FB451DRAFT_1183873 [Mycena latifolia]|nr:hypothetical protein FB451DRAFT_1183873 [Mycena latifolia]